MNKKWVKVSSVAFVIVLLIAGCGQKSPSFPTGTYTSGNSKIDFNKDGTITVYSVGLQVDSGTYTESDNSKIVINSDECGPDAPGSYKWKFDGSVLNFTVVKDNCFIRSNTLTTGNWTKQ
ncbi:MAG TPA: lipoprotein [Candidatus Bathyarchaeia archaeon]